MADLSKLMTDERIRKIEYLHYLMEHKHKDNQLYNEILDALVSDSKEFIKEVNKELNS